jgi:hypothetical protein
VIKIGEVQGGVGRAAAPGQAASEITPPVPPVGGGAGGVSRGARLALLAALILAGLALASNLLLIVRLWRVQDMAAAGLERTIGQLEGFCGNGTVPITFPISQTIHFKSDIALPENMVFPFKGNIPIRTTVRITIPGLPGAPTVEVPINTVVPVDTQVALPGGIRVPIDTTVPIRQDFTVDLCTAGSGTREFVHQLLEELKTVRSSIAVP